MVKKQNYVEPLITDGEIFVRSVLCGSADIESLVRDNEEYNW